MNHEHLPCFLSFMSSSLSQGFVLGDLSSLLVEAGRAACRRLIHNL